MSSEPRFLLTNDDGVDAIGLATLRHIAQDLSSAPPKTVASVDCHSGVGHRVTTNADFQVNQQHEQLVTITGTPADCVRVGLDSFGDSIDWILSGINHGGNLGADVYMSGTVAAVREGVLHGKPGIAMSYYHRKGIDPLDWQRARRWLTPVVRDLMKTPWEPGTFWNVNLPHLPSDAADPEVRFCSLDPSPLPLQFDRTSKGWRYVGDYHQRPRIAGSDVDCCFSGFISVSLVRLYA